MNSLPFKVFRLSGGIVEVLLVSHKRPDGVWGTSVLQQLPGWGFRVAELTPVASDDCIPRILEGFQRWAGGRIQEVDLWGSPGAPRERQGADQQLKIDSGWVKLKDRHFFRMLEVG
jgi:hypothetical protein